MKSLLNCLQDWLTENRSDGSAYSLLLAITTETLKRTDSPDADQREFDAEALTPAAGGPGDFETAKRWIDRAKFERFAEARQAATEEHFRAVGHSKALRRRRLVGCCSEVPHEHVFGFDRILRTGRRLTSEVRDRID